MLLSLPFLYILPVFCSLWHVILLLSANKSFEWGCEFNNLSHLKKNDIPLTHIYKKYNKCRMKCKFPCPSGLHW